MPYTIDNLVDDRNRALYTELNAQLPLRLETSTVPYWGSRFGAESATIFMVPTEHPVASFTHELLHLKLRLDGLIRPTAFTSRPLDLETVNFFYNELAHHKMFPLFLGMGFQPDEFYSQLDAAQSHDLLANDFAQLRMRRRSERSLLIGLDVARPYMLIYAPSELRASMVRYAQQLDELADRRCLRMLDDMLIEWIETDTLDMRRALARIYLACGLTDVAFGFDSEGSDLVIARAATA
ncbi:MAG: hypothetical protein JNJ94_03510 [Chlorobi bacterium]|jgi:hypothetical protein|nr:hypothetical protein [Chlorobiota bacterium]